MIDYIFVVSLNQSFCDYYTFQFGGCKNGQVLKLRITTLDPALKQNQERIGIYALTKDYDNTYAQNTNIFNIINNQNQSFSTCNLQGCPLG